MVIINVTMIYVTIQTSVIQTVTDYHLNLSGSNHWWRAFRLPPRACAIALLSNSFAFASHYTALARLPHVWTIVDHRHVTYVYLHKARVSHRASARAGECSGRCRLGKDRIERMENLSQELIVAYVHNSIVTTGQGLSDICH